MQSRAFLHYYLPKKEWALIILKVEFFLAHISANVSLVAHIRMELELMEETRSSPAPCIRTAAQVRKILCYVGRMDACVTSLAPAQPKGVSSDRGPGLC